MQINDINYNELATLSETSGVPFEKLCERVERGLPLRTLRPITQDWIDYKSAAKLLNCSIGTICGHMTSKSFRELDYWGVAWRTRSYKKANGKRGCGVLFNRQDIEQLRKIRRATHLGMLASLRVFQAIKQEKI